jgi:N,N'-diacetylchitobiose phosphorylase
MKNGVMQDHDEAGPAPDDGGKFHAHLLSNGRFSTLLSANGGGFSALDGFAITRWVPDPTRDADGVHLYVRDVEHGVFWTPAGGPAPAGGHTVHVDDGVATFRSSAHGIACTTAVCVSPAEDVELRRITLHNEGPAARTIEVTTYAELALNTLAGDAAHPAFSKLFVQTAHDPAREALVAWRRLRSPEDQPLWAMHRLLSDSTATVTAHETDRARFIGRGRDRHRPAALACGGAAGPGPAACLSGTVGNVLDAVFCMRRVVTMEPGAGATFVAVLAAATARDTVLRAIDAIPHVAAAEAVFEQAATAPHDGVAALGLPKRWRELLRLEHAGAPVERTLPAPWAPSSQTGANSTGTDPSGPTAGRGAEELRFFNGWGGFSADATEYVIRMPFENGAPRRPPLPWSNVIANEQAGCIVTESGAVSTWSGNSRENRLTPWSNDPVSDPHAEALYIRDDAADTVWSPTPGPVPGHGDYEVRHGFGYTRFLHESSGLLHDTHVFVPAHSPVRVVRVRVTNAGPAPRRLTLSCYAQLVLGTHEAETRGRVRTWLAVTGNALMARNDERGEFSERVAFAATSADGVAAASWTTDRRSFLGERGRISAPAALRKRAGTAQHAPLDGWTGAGRDACFAQACTVTIEPGAQRTCAFVLGECASEAEAEAVITAFRSPGDIDAALEGARVEWLRRLGTVHIETPAPALDVMVNGWLTYQNLSCRMWARSAFYQSGGALGFRDQLQDSSALLYVDPAITRHQILLHAAHQFVEGDVLHWWHPPLGKGIRTRFADDLLWLPYITAFYIERTGDTGILDERVRYLTAAPLEPDEDEAFILPEDAGVSGTLYEHCCRALDRSLTTGPHGLPLMGVGDWNDGMNRVGREGRGESVWLGFFMFDIMRDFMPICVARNDHDRVAAYAAYHERLQHAVNDAGWDGAWYRRAFYDNGEPLGSANSDECRIDALAQSWAVISGAAPPERGEQALDAVEEYLVDEEAGLIRLLTPPFDRTPNDPGYIKGYLPGVRENGGQYTHGVLWAIRALAELGRTGRAAALLEMLSPATRGGTPANAARYRVEPYVTAADVYGVEPYIGRGGWTWYTGSAGWMYRVALESVLGVDLRRGAELALRPCIPQSWPGYTVTLRLPEGTIYEIAVSRGTAYSITLDEDPGRVHGGALVVPLLRDGRTHAVVAGIPATGVHAGNMHMSRFVATGREPG